LEDVKESSGEKAGTLIAHTMPRAVMTEGLPLPPRLGEMQVVCLVLENTASTSLTVTPVPQQ